MLTKLYADFSIWIDDILFHNDFSCDKAFNFNLDKERTSFHIQLISTSSFYEYDSGWAPDEEFTSGKNVFEIPYIFSGSNWELGFETCKYIVKKYLTAGANAHIVKSLEAVGIGFTDGDIEIIYQS